MKRPCFLLFPFLFFTYGFVVTPQERLSGIEKTKLKSIEKKKEGEETIVSLYFSNTIKEVKKENIYPKKILNHITLSFKENMIIISYKTSSLNGQRKTITFAAGSIIDSYDRAIVDFTIDL